MKLFKQLLFFSLLLTINAVYSTGLDKQEALIKSNDVTSHARLLFVESMTVRKQSLEWMRERNKPDVIAALIDAMRYVGDRDGDISNLLHTFTGENHGNDWFRWMLWLQAHPEIKPFDGFTKFQSELFSSIDPDFEVFIHPDVKHEIRVEEIVWGGVEKDGIPALTNPDFIKASEADYLTDSEPVFGVEINGDVRAILIALWIGMRCLMMSSVVYPFHWHIVPCVVLVFYLIHVLKGEMNRLCLVLQVFYTVLIN